MIFDQSFFKYTLCVCTCSNKALLLKRAKKPNIGKLNGLGGKINFAIETPYSSVIREIGEEANIDLTKGARLHFRGLVTWGKDTIPTGGMYVYRAEVEDKYVFESSVETREGILLWLPLEEIIHTNTSLASNFAYFMPEVLSNTDYFVTHCIYNLDTLVRVITEKFNNHVSLDGVV